MRTICCCIAGDCVGGVFWVGIHDPAVVGRVSQQIHGLSRALPLRKETNIHYRYCPRSISPVAILFNVIQFQGLKRHLLYNVFNFKYIALCNLTLGCLQMECSNCIV